VAEYGTTEYGTTEYGTTVAFKPFASEVTLLTKSEFLQNPSKIKQYLGGGTF